MKKIFGGALACLLAAACGGSNNGFSATYTGSVSEDYNCTSLGTSPTYVINPDQVHIDVDGAGNANIYFESCPNDIFTGEESADGTTITINTTTTYSCQQTAGNGDSLDITQIGGYISFSGGGIVLQLSEQAVIDNDTCVGTANGTLD